MKILDKYQPKIPKFIDQFLKIKKKQLNKKQKKYKENKEEILIQHKERYANDEEFREKQKLKAKIWRSVPANKVKINERKLKKKEDNIQIRIRSNISNAIRQALIKRSSRKSRSIRKSLNFTIDDLILKFENVFNESGNEWMNWNNWGKYNPETWIEEDKSTWVWNIDHFIADSLFNYVSEDDQGFKDSWDLSNLRPYSAKLNIEEGNRR